MEWELVLDLVSQRSENIRDPDAQAGEDREQEFPSETCLHLGLITQRSCTHADSLLNHKGIKKS